MRDSQLRDDSTCHGSLGYKPSKTLKRLYNCSLSILTWVKLVTETEAGSSLKCFKISILSVAFPHQSLQVSACFPSVGKYLYPCFSTKVIVVEIENSKNQYFPMSTQLSLDDTALSNLLFQQIHLCEGLVKNFFPAVQMPQVHSTTRLI